MLFRHWQGFYKLCNLCEQENVGAAVCFRLLYTGTPQYAVSVTCGHECCVARYIIFLNSITTYKFWKHN